MSVEMRSASGREGQFRKKERKMARTGRTDENDEAHREAEETTETVDEEELEEVVNGRIDPATTLRHENLEIVGGDGLSLGEAGELELVLWEVLENDGGEIAIFSEREEVL
jgi:hypothetical protein